MQSCYIPFGYGARLCLGKPFAQAGIKQFVADILMQFEVCMDPRSGTTSQTMAPLGTQERFATRTVLGALLKPNKARRWEAPVVRDRCKRCGC